MIITFYRVRLEKNGKCTELAFWTSEQAEAVANIIGGGVYPITLPRDYDPDYFDELAKAANISDIIYRAGYAAAASPCFP